MNSFEKIQAAATAVGLNAYPDVYTEGKEDHYLTYNFYFEQPALFGDDAPGAQIGSVQVHIFLPMHENFFALRRKVMDALFSAGFTYPRCAGNSIERDTGFRHITLEAEDDEEED